jgi:hypothetical protein
VNCELIRGEATFALVGVKISVNTKFYLTNLPIYNYNNSVLHLIVHIIQLGGFKNEEINYSSSNWGICSGYNIAMYEL